MQTYDDAITALPIPKLTEFLKAQVDMVEIEGWAGMRAPEKRTQMLEALKQVKELRKEFVAFYAEATGKDSDFSEWESANPAPDEAAAPDPDGNASSESAPVADAAPATEATTDEPELPMGQEPIAAAIADAEVVAESPAPAKSKAKGKAVAMPATPAAFVEGAFEGIMAEVAGLDAQQSKANLQEVENALEFEHIRIGALLSHIADSQHFTTLGYDNIRGFISGETNMDYRKAVYLIANFRTIKALGIPATALKGVTWSALRHVTPILTAENATLWLDAARSTTHASLINAVALEKAKQAGALPPPMPGDGTAALPETVSKVFNLYPGQKATIDAAIDKAKIEGNLDAQGAALELIAAAYTGAPPSDATVAAVMPDLSDAGLAKMFSRIKAQEGDAGLVRLLNALEPHWPEVGIEVNFPQPSAA